MEAILLLIFIGLALYALCSSQCKRRAEIIHTSDTFLTALVYADKVHLRK